MTKRVNITTDTGADVGHVTAAVSRRLKEYRQQGRLSLDELSRRAGVSKGMLVEIEKGAANPSIAILCKLAAALGVSVADIVDVASTPTVHLIEPQAIPTLWQGPLGGSARLLAGTRGPDMIELWHWQLHPGEQFDSDGHPPGTVELFHVEQGTLQLQLGESELAVTQGCSAVARTDLPHAYRNAGDSVLRFTMTVVEPHG